MNRKEFAKLMPDLDKSDDEVLPQSPEASPCSECGRGFEPSNGVPRWDADPEVLRWGWLANRCGNCGASE